MTDPVRLVPAASICLAAFVCLSAAASRVQSAESPAVGAPFDGLLESKAQSAGVSPAATCDDALFQRRAWIDIAGHVPPAVPARDFLLDDDSQRRVRLVDELLASPDFYDHWGNVLTEIFTAERPVRHDTHDGRVLSQWLADSLRAGRSYRDIAHDLIAGEGTTETSGPANFLFRYDVEPEQLTGAVATRFLGVSLQCAQCHNHPFQQWEQDDFWGVAAFFARTKRLDGDNGTGDYLRAVAEVRRGELQIDDPTATPDEEGNRPQKTVAPRFIDDSVPDESVSRREALANWITADGNAWFARNAANRVWAKLFGRGLVEPLDGLGAAEPGPHSDVLDALAAEFTASDYDLKQLLRTIVLSRTYARASAGPEENGATQAATDLYAVFPVRPLTIDELYGSVVQATGHTGIDEEEIHRQLIEDPNSETYFAYRDYAGELMFDRALTVQRSLVLLNSAYVDEAVRQGAANAIASHGTRAGDAHIEHLFLATLSRRPNDDELAEMRSLLERADWKQQGLEDVLWVLINSAEFNLQR